MNLPTIQQAIHDNVEVCSTLYTDEHGKRVQDAKFVIDNRDNLFFWTASLLRKSDPKFAERFPLGSDNDVTDEVRGGTWKL